MKKRATPPPGPAVNITSLCDIMLCLLIFFMLVSKKGVIRYDKDNPINPPTSAVGTPIEDFGNTITLSVYPGADDDPLVTTLDPSSGRPFEMSTTGARGKMALSDFLKKVMSENPKFSKVIVRAGEETEVRWVEPVLLTISAAKVPEVAYEAKKPQ